MAKLVQPMVAPARLAAGRTAAHAAGLAAALLSSCSRHEPPSPDGIPSVALPEFEPGSRATASSTLAASSKPIPTAAPMSTLTPDSTPGTDVEILHQTRDFPRASGAPFDTRVSALWDAIVEDDPERAMIFFFPLSAYEQVKDIASPAVDWKRRLVAAYARDIHALHGVLEGGAKARLVSLDVPEARARWVEPGEEYNKIGYFRVFGSKLRYDADGAARAIEVKSLISWRGDWYVVHLSAIK
jgi:hypothetical protein